MHACEPDAKPPPQVVTVLLLNQRYKALLDSGSSVSTLRAEFALARLPFVQMATIAYLHGLLVQVQLTYRGGGQ